MSNSTPLTSVHLKGCVPSPAAAPAPWQSELGWAGFVRLNEAFL